MDLETLLKNVLISLKQDIEPCLETDRAKSSMGSIMRVLSRIVVNDPAGSTLHAMDTPDYHLLADPVLRDALASPPEGSDIPRLLALAAREGHVLADVEERVSGLLASLGTGGVAHEPSPGQNAEAMERALEEYLRNRFANREITVKDFRHVVGGRVKQTAFMTITGHDAFRGTVVLRMDGAVNLSGGKSVTYEYPLLEKLAGFGLKIPRPLLLEADGSVLGQPFMLVERLPGAMAGSFFVPPSSPAVMASHAAELAKLHRIPVDTFADVDMPHSPPPMEALKMELDGIESVCASPGIPSSHILRGAFAWLRDNLELAYQGTPSLAHRDALFHNILIDGDEVTALLDWELARISYAAEDLGYIRATVPLVMPWEDYMAHYHRAGGPAVDQAQVDFYAVLSVARNCSLSSNVHGMVSAALTRDIELTSVAIHDIYRHRCQLWEHLQRATA